MQQLNTLVRNVRFYVTFKCFEYRMNIPSRIKPFDVHIETSRLPSEWEVWKLDLESFFIAQRIETQSERRAQLAYLGGPGLQELLRHLPGVNQVPHVTLDPPFYDVAIRCLDEYFEPFRRKTFERHVFHQIRQTPGERFADFVMRLRKQISRCGYDANVVDELIADRIAQGCASEDLRIKLLQKDRSLEEIVALGTSMVESAEHSKKFYQLSTLKPESHDINKVSERRWNWKPQNTKREGMFQQPRFEKRTSERQTDRFICYSCGRRGHMQGSDECPAKRTKCANCGRIGHWAKRCYSRGDSHKRRQQSPGRGPPQKRIRAITEEVEKQKSSDYIFFAMGRNVFMFKVGGVDIPMTIDSGADANVITSDIWEQMKESGVKVCEMTNEVDRTLIAYASNEPMKMKGMFHADIEAGNRRTFSPFYVVENGQQCLLGDKTAKELQVLKIGLNVNSINSEPKKPFPKIRGFTVEIPIDKDVQPVQQPYRRPPIAMEEEIGKKLRALLERDIIERVAEPSPWVSPMVPVAKDSGEIRLCIDMRQANKAVLRETHPLPIVEELLGSVNGAVRFSKIDIKDAYHQVEISERSRPITTFITKYGLFR